MMMPTRLSLLLLLSLVLLPSLTSAQVFYSKEEAFELAFGKDAVVEDVPVFLTDEQLAAVEKMANVKIRKNTGK